jgi:hypothetical protein
MALKAMGTLRARVYTLSRARAHARGVYTLRAILRTATAAGDDSATKMAF